MHGKALQVFLDDADAEVQRIRELLVDAEHLRTSTALAIEEICTKLTNRSRAMGLTRVASASEALSVCVGKAPTSSNDMVRKLESWQLAMDLKHELAMERSRWPG